MSSPITIEALDIKIENTVKDLDDFKQDIKEELKEIKVSIKQNEQLFNETIVSLRENDTNMKENIKWLTTIAEQQREELKLIRESQTQLDNAEEKKWYQDNFNKIIIFLFFLIFTLLGLDASGIELLK